MERLAFTGIGFTLGMVFVMILMNIAGKTQVLEEAKLVIGECELTLPRNQNCILTATSIKQISDDWMSK